MTPNLEHLKLWIDDLENGGHKQTQGMMTRHQADGYSYCCLGRLCEVALANEVPIQRRDTGAMVTYDHMGGSWVPSGVVNWLGIPSGRLATYANLNDTGHSFSEIARILRARFLNGTP